MKLCLVEDQGYKLLYPLTKTRPVFGLRCGKFTLEERILKNFGPQVSQVHYLMRPELKAVWKLKNQTGAEIDFDIPGQGDRLILNGRVLYDESSLRKIMSKTGRAESAIWLLEDTWGAIYLPEGHPAISEDELMDNSFDFSRFRNQVYLDLDLITYPWDLIRYNYKMIGKDFSFIKKRLNKLCYPPLPREVAFVGDKKLIIGSYADIYPFVTFDTTHGPIIIGDNVTIEPGAFIKGPVSIGDNCLVSANTKIYSNTSLGETCKVGGEISHSIIQGFSNKRHNGFLGNAYLGEWVNLGAGTNNSNLKNNYNTIAVQLNGERIDTGTQFVGLFMGDHSRSAIGATFNTATFIGVGCNIFGTGFPLKRVDDFTWGGIEDEDIYDFSKFVQNARRMMIRREVELSRAEIKLLKSIHSIRTIDWNRDRHKKQIVKTAQS